MHKSRWKCAAATIVLLAAYGETRAAPTAVASVPEETAKRSAAYPAAFENQTRAPKPATPTPFAVETVATGLQWPWSIKILPDGRMLVTEKFGRLRIVKADGTIAAPIPGVPAVDPADAKVKGGLLDVALAPDFPRTRRIYLSYSEPRQGGSGTAVATGVLARDYQKLEGLQVIWRMAETSPSHQHYGSRLAFDKEGHLFITTGERAPDGGEFGREAVLEARMQAQDMMKDAGKVLRINADGSIPSDNPFRGRKDARADIWSAGHRNILAAAVNPATDELWTTEHGPLGGDELNQPQAGKNYGWPVISYGLEYDGTPVGKGITAQEGMEQPVYFWDPNVAPGGMIFYTGALFPAWRGDILIAGLNSMRLSRLVIDGHRVVSEEWIPIGTRVRDVVQDNEGALYLLTDEEAGKILRIVPK
jgi:glucose/arabinose dehydrogenase